MNLEYNIETDRAFDEVVGAVERMAGEHNFRVLHIHDVQATLAEKGLQREPLKIIEICNGQFAHKALGQDMRTSLFIPCKINVYTEAGKTKIKAMRPLAISEVFPEAGLDDLAREVDGIIIDIVDRAAVNK